MTDVVIKRENRVNTDDDGNDNVDSEEYKISSLEEVLDCRFKYDNEYQKTFKIHPDDRDIVIDDTFLIAIINLDVCSDLNIPTVFLSLVTRDSWIKSE